MFKFNYSKYNPRGLFSRRLIHGRSFPFQKLVPKHPGAYTRWGLLSDFTIFYFYNPSYFGTLHPYCKKPLQDSSKLQEYMLQDNVGEQQLN